MEDRLQELKKKKLEQQVLYLKSELEETQWIFQGCLRDFDVEFRKYFKEPTKKEKGDTTADSPEYDIPIEDVNSVFKKKLNIPIQTNSETKTYQMKNMMPKLICIKMHNNLLRIEIGLRW